MFKKNSSVKDLIYPFCLSKCFGRNNIVRVSVSKMENGKVARSSCVVSEMVKAVKMQELT